MAVVSLGEILKLKELLAPCGYTLHMHDACGGQSFALEQTSDTAEDRAFFIVEEFFASRNMAVRFFGSKRLDFTVNDR